MPARSLRTLLVVDVQKGFLNEFTHHIPAQVTRLVARERYDRVLFTLFVNTPDSSYQRFLDWHACERPPETDLAPELQPLARPGRVFEKRGRTGAPGRLLSYLARNRIVEVELVGIDTDMCVLKTAMDLFDRGVKPVVLTDLCASTAGLQAHLSGLAVLSKNVGPQQLRVTSLGEGEMAAPQTPPPAKPPPNGRGARRRAPARKR